MSKRRVREMWVGDYGVRFRPAGRYLFLNARFCRLTGDLPQFLEYLHRSILLWCNRNPYTVKKPRKAGMKAKDTPIPAGPVRRFPVSTAQLEDLYQRAAHGPAEVYKWVYGYDSLMAKAMHGTSWSDFGVTDPAEGCRRVLEAIRAHTRDLRAVRSRRSTSPDE